MEIVNWKDMNSDDIYCCFSFPLFKYITSHGIDPITIDTHKKTNRTFSVFIKGDRLQVLLSEWTANRPTENKKKFKDIEKFSNWQLKESGDSTSERKENN